MSDEIRRRMWKAIAESPYLMVRLVGASEHAEPMTIPIRQILMPHSP